MDIRESDGLNGNDSIYKVEDEPARGLVALSGLQSHHGDETQNGEDYKPARVGIARGMS